MPNDYTKTAIKAAFIRLLNERPLNKISVKSIVDICNISRNTFYYNYQDIYAVIEELFEMELAAMLGMSQTGYSKYETGENDIPTSILLKLADIYGTTTDYLLGRTDTFAPPKKK